MNTVALTAAIDLGKYRCHWVVAAWWQGAGGVVADYGVAEVHGTDKSIDNEASEPMIYKTLLNWRDELLNKNYTDATGTIRKVDFCMVDSGTFTNAAYEFTRQVRGIFHPSKGLNPYHQKKASTSTIIAGANLHASRLAAQDLWLYDLDTSYWKQWVHERFLTPTFDENNMLRRGSLSLYSTDGTKTHSSYAQHIVAEELVTEFKEGKGSKTYWNQKNENNHWLDATYMAAAASEACGVKLMAVSDDTIEPRHISGDKPKPQPKAQQHGNRFRTRPGGGSWIQRRR
jgi:phage terminase large subunit GpA-like protein